VAISATEWFSSLTISGNYNGPTDIDSARDYVIEWTTDGKVIIEKGAVTLHSTSAGNLRSEWFSTIAATERDVRNFPAAGQIIRVSFSDFKISTQGMSYEWEGTVSRRPTTHSVK